ncbi:TfuA-like protein [Rhizobium sp. CB3171]|uniref:TfuA-like protein n=1 Tax=Rhizobium sp. CB3171 TaxID=3039157 RepID=UPI0024B05E12|nr:TfuA-like protein [Rhizobium sp. CB3171]WFU01571.1 TfuA-like protein [Rhizobium sp. CB3171]
MKVIFGGPTLYGAASPPNPDYQLWPPAKHGDFYRAIKEGANVIGLIDGIYEYVPAIWHKEILFGLSEGVQIFGAASMGALRAAECAAFGMVGIGTIYESFSKGELEDDADVAQSHGPSELGYLPLSEPLVNVRATLSHCLRMSLVTKAEHDHLLSTAKSIFFKDRTYRKIVSSCTLDSSRAAELIAILRDNNINQKLQDAELLVQTVTQASDERITKKTDWTFEKTNFWKALFRTE